MKIVQINATCGLGSTGKICVGISQLLNENFIENYILYSNKGNNYQYGISCSSDIDIKFNALKSRILGNYGFNSKKETKKMIVELERIKPDIVHLHNIHGHDCNMEMLCSYLKQKNIKVIYTFHDCWAFTGYCPHFIMAKCHNWLEGCGDCVLKNNYSWFFDKSAENYTKKRNALNGMDLTIVTPSEWLADLVKRSFLKDCSIKIINNGIDLSVFKPVLSGFRKKHGLENYKIILGVSYGWSKNKGVDVFDQLAKRLPSNYKIVLVGTNHKIEKELSSNILSIHRTQNQNELAEIYTAADVFINPSREENYPTVNMESLACGTPVITFKTGGSHEMLDDTCGSIVACNDIDALQREIIRICTDNPYSEENCFKRAKDFENNNRYKEYLDLYERINSQRN